MMRLLPLYPLGLSPRRRSTKRPAPRTRRPAPEARNVQNADSKTALKTGLLLILLFPSDLIILLTVGINLEHNALGLVAALPFIGATTLIAALPLLLYLLFHRRAKRFMPQVRDWMNTHSWLVNIIVCVIFIALILL